MADPVSLVGLGVGLISFGLQVCDSITKYLGGLKCREEDIASARRQVDTTGAVLQLILTSISRFQSSQHGSTAGVAACLRSCEDELKALENHVAEITGTDITGTSFKDRLKIQNKKLAYSFNREKLQQLESRMAHVNSILQLALQSLGMSVTI